VSKVSSGKERGTEHNKSKWRCEFGLVSFCFLYTFSCFYFWP